MPDMAKARGMEIEESPEPSAMAAYTSSREKSPLTRAAAEAAEVDEEEGLDASPGTTAEEEPAGASCDVWVQGMAGRLGYIHERGENKHRKK